MELKEATNLFLDQYKKSTRKAFASGINKLLEYVGSKIPVDQITDLDMIRVTNGIKQGGYAPATIRKHIKTLKTFFNWLIRRRLISQSPMDDVKNITIDPYIGRNKALSEKQLKRLLDYIDRNQQRYIRQRALVLFLADTGCRIGGAANLKWSDIDLPHQTAILTEKGDRTRPAFFFELCNFALNDWKIAQERTHGDYVFSYRGGAISSSSLQSLFRRVCIASGIGSHGPHKLRHRKAHQLVDAGIAPSTAATVIGDTPEVFIAHYAPRDFESAKEAARLVATRPKNPKVITATTKKKA